MSTPVLRRVFLSSTVYDLRRERDIVQHTLDEHVGTVSFECIRSDGAMPRFAIAPADLAARHSYDISVEAVAECDYFILLINARYGRRLIVHDGATISITHREYREAYIRRLPLLIFVNQRAWDARHAIASSGSQSYVPGDQLGVFAFIDEITRSPRANWIHRYTNPDDIIPYLNRYLFTFDDDRFVADVTVPDGAQIPVDTVFEKVWEVENTGCVVWRNRYLVAQNALASGLIPAEPSVRLPETCPGERVRIRVSLRTPRYPSTCESLWKMVDEFGRLCFPRKKGLFCRVCVVDR